MGASLSTPSLSYTKSRGLIYWTEGLISHVSINGARYKDQSLSGSQAAMSFAKKSPIAKIRFQIGRSPNCVVRFHVDQAILQAYLAAADSL